MSDYSFTCMDAASTAERGATLAPLLRPGDIILLYGDLGAGKTTFVRGLIQGLNGADTNVVSPTFTLVQTYPTPKGLIYHYDLYRLAENDHAALVELGWDDGLVSGITLVEWPERLGKDVPKDALIVRIDACGPDGRTVSYTSQNPDWVKRLS